MRISDWSSDVCSSDLFSRRPKTAILRFPPFSTQRKANSSMRSNPFRGSPWNGKQTRLASPSKALCWLDSERKSGCRKDRSEEHTSELQSLMRTSYAVLCLKKKKNTKRKKDII